jgi:hypothetical protein
MRTLSIKNAGYVAHLQSPLALAMPNGASGIWYAKDYDSSKRAIPNAATGAALVNVYTRYNTQEIPVNENGDYQEWALNTGTLSTVSATGPTATTINTTRILTTTDFYVSFFRSDIAAGTYTLAFDVKSNTGSSQNFQCGNFHGTMAQKTATTSWQRITNTFTSGSADIWPMLVMSYDRATGVDLLVANISIFKGSADLGRVAGANMLFDGAGSTQTTNPATGVIDLSGGGSAIVQLDTAISNIATGFTGGAMLKRVANSLFAYQSIFSRLESFTTFTSFIELDQNTLSSYVGGQAASAAGMWDTNGQGWHLLTYRWDGTNFDIFLDNSRVLHQPLSSVSSVSLRNILISALKFLGNFNVKHQFNSWFFYPTVLTTNQIQQSVYPTLKARVLADGLTHTQARIVCAEGDSITALGSSYYIQSAANVSGLGVNYAVPSSAISHMVARLTSAGVQSVPVSGTNYIISVCIGANDLLGYGGSTNTQIANNFLSTLFSYTDTLRSAGWRVLLCTVLPKNDSTFNAVRAIANAGIRAAIGTHCDAVCDFDTDAQMGVDNSFTAYPANWIDGTHPNTAGHTRLAPIYTTAINAM